MKELTRSHLLAEATELLGQVQKQDARLSAEVILAHVLGVDRTSLFRDDTKVVSSEETTKFLTLIERRADHEPVAYLVGEKEFYSLPFYVDSSVLVPRPESELLVDLALEKLKDRPNGHLLDVGTGSGAIAITLKKHLPHFEVFGSDVSGKSLAVARKNGVRHDVEITWMQSDLLRGVGGTFDAIVANLPYIPEGDIKHLNAVVRDYEPHVALDGGCDGRELIGRLISEAKSHLRDGGWLFLEVGNAQEEEVRGLLQNAGYEVEEARNDYQGIPRAVLARWS